MVNFEEKFQTAYLDLESNANIVGMLNLLQKELSTISGDNFNYITLYFERILSEYTLNRDLWEVYINFTEDMCKVKEQRLSIHYKAVKNCPSERDFWLGYLRELESNADKNDAEKIQATVVQAIDSAGEAATLDF